MKAYDYVRVPDNGEDWLIDRPVIVLTIEELRELWDKAYDCGYADNGKDVFDYLTDKGLKL